MEEKINLKEIERKSFRFTFQDGLFDILLGFIGLNFGVNILISDVFNLDSLIGYIVMMILYTIGFVIFFAGKKFITTPRIGHVKFAPSRKIKMAKIVGILLISVLLGMVLAILAVNKIIPPSLERPVIASIFFANVVIIFSLIAYYLDLNRIYLYGILFAIPLFLALLLDFPILVVSVSIISTGIIIIIGIAMLIKFRRKYPKQDEDEFYDKF